jgi:hypothetical protein
MIVFSLALVVMQIVAVASANRYLPINHCQISLDNYRFDLCPLLDERHNSGRIDLVLHHPTPPTITTIVYNINLNGPLRSSDGFPDNEQVSLAAANCGDQSIQFHLFIQCVSGTWACVTSKLLSDPTLSCSRLNWACLAREHPPGPDLGEDDRGAEVIPIVMRAPQSGQLDSSVGDKEALGIYAELRESDKFRTSLSYIGILRCHV